MKILRLLAAMLTVGLCFSPEVRGQADSINQTNEYAMAWNATGYTFNAKGKIVATNVNQRAFVLKAAQDNGLNPNDLVFVYRVEKRDTAVVYKSTGAFVADVYQMQYTYTDITNASGEFALRETLLNDEYHNNAIGTTWGVENAVRNKDSYLTSYSYHGTFHYFFPEDNVIFTGSFSTGPRVKETDPPN